MRKKPMNNNYGHKKRYDNNRSGGGHHNRGGNSGGQRKNWPALRERYLTQARDALASGERVLAENFHQHADHCWRMMMEEGSNRPRQSNPQHQQNQPAENSAEDNASTGNDALPAFITTPSDQSSSTPPVQNWEERDAD